MLNFAVLCGGILVQEEMDKIAKARGVASLFDQTVDFEETEAESEIGCEPSTETSFLGDLDDLTQLVDSALDCVFGTPMVVSEKF